MKYINSPESAPENMLHRTMYSEILNHEIGYCIYLPPDYEADNRRYPAVYHLHGWTGSESSEIHAMETVCRSRNAITVFPNSSPVIEDRENLPIERFIIQEFIPFIDRTYRTVPLPGSRTLSGFSMGGGAAFHYAVKYPDLFSGVTAYAGTYHHFYEQGFITVGAAVEKADELYALILNSPDRTENNILSMLNRNADLLRGRLRMELRVGTQDPLYCENEIMHLHLNALQIPHDYIRISGADHSLHKIT